jgi:hypothetical protein
VIPFCIHRLTPQPAHSMTGSAQQPRDRSSITGRWPHHTPVAQTRQGQDNICVVLPKAPTLGAARVSVKPSTPPICPYSRTQQIDTSRLAEIKEASRGRNIDARVPLQERQTVTKQHCAIQHSETVVSQVWEVYLRLTCTRQCCSGADLYQAVLLRR